MWKEGFMFQALLYLLSEKSNFMKSIKRGKKESYCVWADSSFMFTIMLEVPFVMYVCDFQAAPLYKTQPVIDFPHAQGEWQ